MHFSVSHCQKWLMEGWRLTPPLDRVLQRHVHSLGLQQMSNAVTEHMFD